ncbi:MurR/RpiR family transcriptional regulator [Paludicola sp. MB14-C6]|uniref:MurR/RpiR family transcriptional regulator n=1 Tax=Paludihabitans sp. MB14-C6 TaxID=3070656 RepID=UPI0027DB065C|nr:MurR/RpiR family transcriptional regulator [Paludicola sp. MB14-C6]WMJ23530.1 MurR/RpiR family transcriptional regulator [Paludicola sp. MB14-C6]
MSSNILNVIEAKMIDFSKGQRCIATYILNHYDKAAYMTAAKLGVAAGVSESTVVRFAFELGFDGYPELQQELAEMIKNKLTSIQRIEVASEQIGETDVLDKVLNIDINKIRKTLEETSRKDFDGAVDALAEAKSIYILGSRSASVLARFLALYFNIMFDSVKLIHTTSSSEMFEQIMRIKEHDIIIGISFPRYSKKTVKAMEFAANQGAKVIAITDSATSPLAKSADFFLQARSDMVSFVDSLVAPLSLINALIVAVGLRKGDELKKTFDKLESIWDEYDVYQKSEDNQ